MKKLFICFLSGIATCLGYFFCYLKTDKEKLLTSTLSFAASVMFFISVFELIPEGISLINSTFKQPFYFIIIIIFYSIGVLIAISINKFIEKNDDNLYRVGVYTSIGLVIHNILEGLVTYLTLKINTNIGIKMAFSIALHNIPEGISVAMPLFHSLKGRRRLFLSLVSLGLSEVFGALMAFILFKNINMSVIGELYLVIAGIMTYIAVFELLKESLELNHKKLIIPFVLLGIFIIFILTFL